MERNRNHVLHKELVNLQNSCKSPMKSLKSNSNAYSAPQFLAQVSEMEEHGPSDEHTISLYEVLARVYGRNIVPQIHNIMATVVKTLTSSPGSFPLHQACAKVVPAIARYGIDPLIPNGEKAKIINSLCNPLSDILMGSPQSVATGAALCLKALVESSNWRFASDDVVNDVCLRVACALEENPTQTISHMGLTMALGKHNSLIVEAYARSILRSGLEILRADVTNGNSNSQKRFSAIQMIHFLMKCIDSRSVCPELVMIVDVMEKCHLDQMPFIRGAAFEALQTAKAIADEEGLRFENELSATTGSNFGSRSLTSVSRSPRFGSPESQTIHSFMKSDSFSESSSSVGQASSSRKRWKYEHGVDVPLKDGLFSEVESGGNCSNLLCEHSRDGEVNDKETDCAEVFSGFADVGPTEMRRPSATSSAQTSHSQVNIDDSWISLTPRKLFYSLQEPNDVAAKVSVQEARRPKSNVEVGLDPVRERNGNNLSQNSSYEVVGFELVSLTGDVPTVDAKCEVLLEVVGNSKNGITESREKRGFKIAALGLVFGLSLIFPVLLSAIWSENQDRCFNLVPT